MKFNYIFLTVLILIGSRDVWAQLSENSPLSAIGIGDLSERSVVSTNSMPGFLATYADPYNVNLVNPASYASLAATAFDLGIDAVYSKIKDNNTTQSAWGGNFKYLSLSFPLSSPVNILLDRKEKPFKMGMNISLLPVSRMDYRINQTINSESEGEVLRQYGGNGGLNKFQLGSGGKYKNLSFGLNIGFLFGSIENEQALLDLANTNAYHSYTKNSRTYNGFIWNAGLQYRYYLNQDVENPENSSWLTFGLYGNTNIGVNVDQENIVLRRNAGFEGLDDENMANEFIDTISISSSNGLESSLPAEIGLGIMYSKSNRLRVGLNFAYNNWENFNNILNIGTLRNSWNVASSLEYTPNPGAILNYWDRVSYRGSVYYNNDAREFSGDGLSKKGVQVGLGLPIFQKRQLSYFNIAVDMGQLSNNTVTENFVRFNLGVTLNNNLWFYKRKFE
ncbi:hypothetical protein [Membranihabitans marinus]|uniref:hypothetical protein n=1 Tax=Membranihabitans marinus TaxID=1227546 RepID=UPI001F42443A|nr:hypothetical protein [Membranihabitans marinus]